MVSMLVFWGVRTTPMGKPEMGGGFKQWDLTHVEWRFLVHG